MITRMMTWAEIELLRCELVALYGVRPAKAAYLAEVTAIEGYCPFVAAGRQYIATTFRGRAGYAVRDEGPAEVL